MLKKKIIRNVIGISVLSLSLFSGACASGKPPVEKIPIVEHAIIQARESIATTYAPVELKIAEDKLAEAKSLMEQKDYVPAGRLLDEALVDAKLAETKSRSVQKKTEVTELRDSINALRNETQFKSQGK